MRHFRLEVQSSPSPFSHEASTRAAAEKSTPAFLIPLDMRARKLASARRTVADRMAPELSKLHNQTPLKCKPRIISPISSKLCTHRELSDSGRCSILPCTGPRGLHNNGFGHASPIEYTQAHRESRLISLDYAIKHAPRAHEPSIYLSVAIMCALRSLYIVI